MTLLVVGALHWDVIVRAPRLPRRDETLRGQNVDYRLGGKGGNQAIAAARAGAQVAFAGRIGDDTPGQTMAARLAEAGIDITGLQRGTGASGMSTAIVTEDGDYGAVIVSAENLAFDPGALSIGPGCRMVLLQNELAPEATDAVIASAQAAKVPVVMNAAPALDLDPARLTGGLDTVIVNRVEGADLTGMEASTADPLRMISALATRLPGSTILLTLGGDGVLWCAPGAPPTHQPAQPVTVTSTHGAGDVFVGAFCAARLSGASLDQSVARGQSAAAAHVSQTP